MSTKSFTAYRFQSVLYQLGRCGLQLYVAAAMAAEMREARRRGDWLFCERSVERAARKQIRMRAQSAIFAALTAMVLIRCRGPVA